MIGFGWFVLAGCAQTENGTDQAIAPVMTRTLAPATATPIPLPTIPTTPTPTDLPGPATLAAARDAALTAESGETPARDLIDAVMAELVTEYDRDPAAIRLLTLEQFTWADKTWECANHPADVETSPGPGYRLIFSAGSRIYVYHADEQNTFFQCTDRAWLTLTGTPVPLDPIAQSMVDLAISDASHRLDVAPETLILTSLLVIDWPDSSVGCPKPNAEYADQPTTGYRIVLQTTPAPIPETTAEPEATETPPVTEMLIYHTSIRHIVKCDPAEEILPGFMRRAWPNPTPTPTAAPE